MDVAVVALRTAQLWASDATVRTRRIAEGLARRGHDVTVLCARWWDGGHTTFEQDGVSYRAVVDSPSAGTFAARLPTALARLAPDIVHAVASPPAAVAAARVAGALRRTPLVVDWWADHPADRQAAYRRLSGLPRLVTVPSRHAATGVREYGVPEEQVEVVPETVDMDLVRSAPVDSRADIVTARRLDGTANVESFLLTLAELRDRTWRAAVVGDGPERTVAERTAADLRIDDRVAFLGDLPLEEAVSVFKGAHVFVQTATEEPFPTELCLALACGCVGIVEYQSGSAAHELVEGRSRGFRVTNPQAIANSVVDAADLDRRTIDERYADYDRTAVLDRLDDRYRTLAGVDDG